MVCIRSEALIFDQWLKITEPVCKLKKLFIKFPFDGSLVNLFSGIPFFPFSGFFLSRNGSFRRKDQLHPKLVRSFSVSKSLLNMERQFIYTC